MKINKTNKYKMSHHIQIRWRQQHERFGAFIEGVKSGLYNLTPPHQRHVVHSDAWQGEIIKSFLKYNILAAPTFHTRVIAGRHVYESLDGKQRCISITRFMNNELKVDFSDTYFEESYTKPVSYEELIDDHKSVMSNNVTLEIKIADREFTDEEIGDYFQCLQETRRTSLGEFLNSSLTSVIRERLIEAEEEIGSVMESLIPNDTRRARLEMLTRIAYLEHVNMTPSLEKFDETPKKIKGWFMKESSVINENFVERVKLTLTLLAEAEISNRNSKSIILPVHKWILENCWSEDEFNEVPALRLRTALTEGRIVLEHVGGSHDASMSRYKQLCEQLQE